MDNAQPSLFLTRLTLDARFAIYSYIVLPPFAGCQDYAGLWLSCRRLYDEIGSVGARQLQIQLQKLSNDILADESEHIGGQADTTKSLEFVAPATVLGASAIRVNCPFELPPPEDDWYYQEFIPKRLSKRPRTYFESPRPLTEDVIANRKRHEQARIYVQSIGRLYTGVRTLHVFRMDIEIHLLSDESTARRIAEDTTLCLERFEPGLLASTILGRLIAMHAKSIADHCRWYLWKWMEDCTFNTQTFNIKWNFATQCSEVQRQAEWKPVQQRSLDKICSRASYTEDRRAGTVQFHVDVVGSIQNQIMKAKRHIKQEMAKKRENEQTMSGMMLEGINRRTAGHRRRLALYRQRLQTRGLAESETPELDEDGP